MKKKKKRRETSRRPTGIPPSECGIDINTRVIRSGINGDLVRLQAVEPMAIVGHSTRCSEQAVLSIPSK